ncbi:hypothetical protein V1511DRAFT_309958 [Dipodascopsis uninucleata]
MHRRMPRYYFYYSWTARGLGCLIFLVLSTLSQASYTESSSPSAQRSGLLEPGVPSFPWKPIASTYVLLLSSFEIISCFFAARSQQYTTVRH